MIAPASYCTVKSLETRRFTNIFATYYPLPLDGTPLPLQYLTCNKKLIIHGQLRPPMVLQTNQVHQQNVNRSGSHTPSSQTLRATSPVLLSTSRCSQTPLEVSKVLSDSARAFSGAPESTCSYGGAFRMQRDLTYRIVKFWSS